MSLTCDQLFDSFRTQFHDQVKLGMKVTVPALQAYQKIIQAIQDTSLAQLEQSTNTTKGLPSQKKNQVKDKDIYDDLGQYAYRKLHDKTYQAIAGHHCYWCQDRAYNHHQHYLREKKSKEPKHKPQTSTINQHPISPLNQSSPQRMDDEEFGWGSPPSEVEDNMYWN